MALNFEDLHERSDLVRSSSRILLRLKTANSGSASSTDFNYENSDLQLPVARRIMKYLYRRWQQGRFCDVKLQCQGGILLAHGVILSAYSPTLDEILGNWEKVEVPVIDTTDFEASLVYKILEFLYTTDIEITDEVIASLTFCSRYLDLLDLFNICCDYLSHYDARTAVLYYVIVKKNDINILAKRIWRFICANFEDVIKTDYFIACDFSTIHKLLADSAITVTSESKVLQAAVRWLDADSDDRSKYIVKIMDCVRLTQMDPEEIIQLEYNPHYTRIPDYLDKLYRAMCYHCLQKGGSQVIQGYGAPRRTGPTESGDLDDEQPACSDFYLLQSDLLMSSQSSTAENIHSYQGHNTNLESQTQTTGSKLVQRRLAQDFSANQGVNTVLYLPPQTRGRSPSLRNGKTTPEALLQVQSVSKTLEDGQFFNLTTASKDNVPKQTEEVLDLTRQQASLTIDASHDLYLSTSSASSPRTLNISTAPSTDNRRGSLTPIPLTSSTKTAPSQRAQTPFNMRRTSTVPAALSKITPMSEEGLEWQQSITINEKGQQQQVQTPSRTPLQRKTDDTKGRMYTLQKKLDEKTKHTTLRENLALYIDEGNEAVSPVRRSPQRLSLAGAEEEIPRPENISFNESTTSGTDWQCHLNSANNDVSQMNASTFQDCSVSTAFDTSMFVASQITEESMRIFIVESVSESDTDDITGNGLLCFDRNKKVWECLSYVPQLIDDAVVLHLNGALYILGTELCLKNGAYQAEPTNLFYRYDIGSGTWHSLAPLLTKRLGHRAVVYEGRIYVVGGIDGNMRYVLGIDKYDPSTNTWQEIDKLSQGRIQPTVVTCGCKLILMGGSKNEGAYSVDVIYRCFENGHWTVCKKFSRPFRYTALLTIRDAVYLMGRCLSNDDQGSVNQVLHYDRENDQWLVVNCLLTQRCDAAHIAVDDTIVILGGVEAQSGILFTEVECFDTVRKCVIAHHPYPDIPVSLSAYGACAVPPTNRITH